MSSIYAQRKTSIKQNFSLPPTHTHTHYITKMQFQILVVLSTIATAIVATPISRVSTDSVSEFATKVNEPMYRARPTETNSDVAPTADDALL